MRGCAFLLVALLSSCCWFECDDGVQCDHRVEYLVIQQTPLVKFASEEIRKKDIQI